MGFDHGSGLTPEEVVNKLKLVQLHEVQGPATRLVEEGPLLLIRVASRPDALDLQVGDVRWTLHKGVPVLKAADRAYTIAAHQRDIFYTIIVADGVPEVDVVAFEQLLRGYTAFEIGGALSGTANLEQTISDVEKEMEEEDMRFRPPQVPAGVTAPTLPEAGKPSWAERISSGTDAGTLYAQEHIAAGATWLGSKIEQQGKHWEQRTTPNAQPTNVSPATLKTLTFASGAARTGANVAGRIVSGVASATASAADHIVRRLTPASAAGPPDPNSKRSIAAASVVAAVDLYESMEQAARRVLDSGGRATTSFVSHKYGPEAGTAAKHAGSAAIDAGMATWSVSRIGVRTVAKKMAKRVAVGVASAHVRNVAQPAAGPPRPEERVQYA